MRHCRVLPVNNFAFNFYFEKIGYLNSRVSLSSKIDKRILLLVVASQNI